MVLPLPSHLLFPRPTLVGEELRHIKVASDSEISIGVH